MKNLIAIVILTLLSFLHSSISRAAESKTIWDSWYTVTVNGTTHYEYYNEKVEIKNGKLYFQNSLWKQEEGFINEEQLGAFAENNEEVSPLFYNYHSVYRSSETVIDATMMVKGSHELSVRVTKDKKQLPVVKRNVPGRTFFSQFFPIWLVRHFKSAPIGKTVSFTTLLEDNIDGQFAPDEGSAKLEATDDFAKQSNTSKIAVEYHGLRSVWYVDGKGETAKLMMPEQNTVVEKVSKPVAKAFFDGGAKSGKKLKTLGNDLGE